MSADKASGGGLGLSTIPWSWLSSLTVQSASPGTDALADHELTSETDHSRMSFVLTPQAGLGGLWALGVTYHMVLVDRGQGIRANHIPRTRLVGLDHPLTDIIPVLNHTSISDLGQVYICGISQD